LAQAREFGWRVFNVWFTRGNIPPGWKIVGAAIEFPFDHPEAAWARKLTCPVVRIGRLPNQFDDRLPAVIADYATAGRLAAEHFAERNFRHIALIGSQGMEAATVAWEAFRRRAEELGCDCRRLSLSSGGQAQTVDQRLEMHARELSQFLEQVPKPIGLFTVLISWAGRLIVMTQAAGLAVPEDVAVLCCGNAATLCETAGVPISAVDMGVERQGREAARLLRRLINGAKAPKTPIIVPPVGVVERHSTNVLIVPDPAVARTLRLIWDHLAQEISVNDIARQVGVSRRSLEGAFRRCVGRSITAERHRKRLERCAELLRGTPWPIESIATATGFSSCSYMYRSFRKKFGVTPAEFREQS
jgi:LacI family transcriptional regulator